MKPHQKKAAIYFAGISVFLCTILLILYLTLDNEIWLGLLVTCFFIAETTLITFLIYAFEDKKQIVRLLWISSAILVPICLAIAMIADSFPVSPIIGPIPLPIFCGLLFIVNKNKIRLYSVLFVLLFLGFFMKLNAWPGGSILITIVGFGFSIGFSMLMVHSILDLQKNQYLRVVSALAFLALALVTAGFSMKIQHMPGGSLLMGIQIYPLITLSVLVLLTLPFSGFTDWIQEQKQLLLRSILVPWIIFLIMASSQYILPRQIFNNIFPTGQQNPDIHFHMDDYDIDDLEPE